MNSREIEYNAARTYEAGMRVKYFSSKSKKMGKH